ncbi:hypothetical protein [Allocoleopsis franciscana]|nr:hypothetical protein [Allocoleopsis franciscana]
MQIPQNEGTAQTAERSLKARYRQLTFSVVVSLGSDRRDRF